MEPESELNFVHKESNIHLSTEEFSKTLIINNIHQLLNLCNFLSQEYFSKKNYKLPLNHSHALKIYIENKDNIEKIIKQNYKISSSFINDYIETHFFEINGISHNITNDLPLNKNLIGEIISFLDPSDISLFSELE